MTITIKPGFRQYMAEYLGSLALATAMTAALVAAEGPAKGLLLRSIGPQANFVCLAFAAGSLVLWIHLIYLYAKMSCTRWQLTTKAIVRRQGLLNKQVDYLELFRVVDYAESQTALQRVFGTKTVRIMSSDMSDPIMPIAGVPERMDLVSAIRTNVEKCKHENNIFEVTNAGIL